MEIKSVTIDLLQETNIIIGQSHFIKTVEDLYEIVVGISSQVKFGIAFCEASGSCLTRVAGNDKNLEEVESADNIKVCKDFLRNIGYKL